MYDSLLFRNRLDTDKNTKQFNYLRLDNAKSI